MCRHRARAVTFARNLASPASRGTSTRDSTPATRMNFPAAETFDFIWAHPPYWRQKALRRRSPGPVTITHARAFPADDTASSSATVPGALKRGGKLAILMGDYSDRDAGFVPLTSTTPSASPSRPGSPSTAPTSSASATGPAARRKSTDQSFIPGLHDVCMIFEKAN